MGNATKEKEKNVKHVMKIGEEPFTNMQKSAKIKRQKALEKYFFWLMGLIISFIPILALPLYLLYKNAAVEETLFHSFCDAEIIFIGISLAIASLNDFIREDVNKSSIWTFINIIVIIFGAMVYGVANISQEIEKNFNYNFAFAINMTFLVVIFLLGTGRYISEMQKGEINAVYVVYINSFIFGSKYIFTNAPVHSNM